MGRELDAVADDLYRLAPAQFVAARDGKAAEATTAGNRSLAAEIKALRRPTQGAWMVNWLAKERAEDLGRLLELGAAFRMAQDRMAGEELRALSRQRHAVVAALAADARRAASDAGLRAGDAASREVEETLSAALADDQVATEVRAGRLSTALTYSGFGTESAGQASSPTRIAAASGSERESTPSRNAGPDPATAEKRRQQEAEHQRLLEEAEVTLHDAETAAADAQRVAADHARGVEEAKERLEQLRQSIQDLQARLEASREQEGDAVAYLREAERRQEHAEQIAAEGEARRADALARLQDLRTGGYSPDGRGP